MTDHNNEQPYREQRGSSDNPPPTELDAASKSLSEALRISFIMLKVIMVVLVVLFLASGFETVNSDEQALVLRFGKIRGAGENRILKPRAWPYWVFPYPIEEIVKIKVKKIVTLDTRSFWYHQTEQELLAESQGKTVPVRSQTLDPATDGYCLTRSEEQTEAARDSDGTDYSIVHSKWQMRYLIDDPEAFFRNVFVKDTKPGEIYFDAVTESLKPLIESVLESAVVTAMAEFTIDDAIKSQQAIPTRVKELIEQKLPKLADGTVLNMCGIKIDAVLLTNTAWPRQVNEAFQASITAREESGKEITKARTEARNLLNEAAGPVADQLYAALRDDNVDDQTREALWSNLSGTAQEKIFQARAYRTKVEADAKANADYFRSLLPEYRKHPDIVVQSIYRDAIEAVMTKAYEKFVVQPTEGEEIRVHLGRDPTIKREPEKKEDSSKK